jgi:CRISPR-associated protein Cmr4
MYTKKMPFFLIALSPVHAGSGSDVGVVDLPIQRERHTDYPKIEASGIKGVFRENYRIQKKLPDELDIIFGPEKGDGHQSAIGFVDARILFFPVKSVKGIFAWITCSDVLKKFKEMMTVSGCDIAEASGAIIDIGSIPVNTIAEGSEIFMERRNGEETTRTVILEEYPFQVCENKNLGKFANWFCDNVFCNAPDLSYQKSEFAKRLLVVDNNSFRDFVTLSTEVIPRTKINPDTGTVDATAGSLWYEEYLPVETIMYSVLLSSQPFTNTELNTADKVMGKVVANWPSIIQIGGNATIGKGFMKPVLLTGGE